MTSSPTAGQSARRRLHARLRPHLGSASQPLLRAARALPSILIALAMVFPFYWIIRTSLLPVGQVLSDEISLLPTQVTFDSYATILRSPFMLAVRNSIITASATAILTVLISLPAAYGFSRRRFPFRRSLLVTVIFSQLFPFIVLVTPMFFIYSQLGLVNSRVGLILLYTSTTVPFSTYMLLGYLDSVPRDMDDAATVDGASTLQIIRQIILPIAWPGVAAVAFFSFARAWEEFLFALTLTTDSDLFTMPVALAQLFGQFTTEWNVVMAASVLSALPTFVVFLFLQRHLVSNLAAGAVK